MKRQGILGLQDEEVCQELLYSRSCSVSPPATIFKLWGREFQQLIQVK
jgi:hypothetical protein